MRACAQGGIRMRGIRVLALAVALGIFHSGATAQTEPLRLGFLTVKTGPLAAGGAQMEQGIVLFLKERNYTLAGRKVELFVGDTGGNPAQAKTRTQELIERNRVHVFIDRKSTRLNSSHITISYAVFCLKKKKTKAERSYEE